VARSPVSAYGGGGTPQPLAVAEAVIRQLRR
jgi:hypothetical protein